MKPGIVPVAAGPGEVLNLRFADNGMLLWDPNDAAGTYNVYRAETHSLPGAFGTCYQSGLAAAQAMEPAQPPPGVAWFYVATVENPLSEEGTKGFTSGGAERSNIVPCP